MTRYVDGKKAGEKAAAQPKIASDSAKSLTTVDMTIGLSEGEIEGFSKADITLDGTPLTALSPDIICDYRFGTNDQTHIDGLDDVSNEVLVGIELTSSLPWVRSITNQNIDAIGIRLGWSALRTQSTNGDVSGASVSYRIEVAKVGEPYVVALEETVSDKTSDDYQRYREIPLPKSTTGWLIRVTRTSPNSTSDLVSDKMYIRSYSELIKAKFTYPYTALVRLKYDAEMFANIAKVAVEAKGLKIKVPSNYNVEAGTVSGIWDGTFKLAYTSNPAWIYYDLCTNPRYALGERIKPTMIDKWSLYRLAQYCDQQVEDGYGGLERRFTCNLYIQSKERAYDIVNRLGGLFRALTFWDGQQVVCDADIPQDTFFLYTNANVKDGLFEYSSVATTDKYSASIVAWDNPANKYETEYEVVIIDSLVQTLGYKPLEIDAWGCTSRGQAVRAGRWALLAESDTVTFTVGMEGHIPIPGKIIEIQDQLHAGIQNGGRILSISADRKTVEIDKDTVMTAGDMFIVNASDTAAISRTVASISGRFVTLTEAYEAGTIDIHRVWILNRPTIVAQKFRILGVKSEDRTTFTISAVRYNEFKFDEIDFNLVLETPPTSIIKPVAQDAVRNVTIEPYDVLYQGLTNVNLIIKWERPEYAVKYLVEWKKDNGSWIKMPLTGNNSVEIEKVYAGNYIARVTAISAFDLYSLPVTSLLVTVKGKQTMPSPPFNLSASSDALFAIKLNWVLPNNSQDTAYTRILATSQNPSTTTVNDDDLEHYDKAYPDTTITFDNLPGNTGLWFKAKLVDKLGLSSAYTPWVYGQASADPDKILEILKGHIGIEAIDAALAAKIELANVNAIDAINIANATKAQTETSVNKLTQDLSAETTARLDQASKLQDGVTKAQNTADGAVSDLTTYKASNDQALGVITQNVTAVTNTASVAIQKTEALEGRVTTVEATTDSMGNRLKDAETNVATALNKSQIAIDANTALSETVSQNTAAIGNKAESTYVEQVKTTAEAANSTANQANTTASTNTTAIQGLKSTVDGNTAQINNVQQTKANKTEVASIAQQALQSVWQNDAKNAADALKPSIENATDLAKLITNGKLLYPDVNFKDGNNSVTVYDNLGGGLNMVSTVPKAADNPTSSPNQMDILVSGTASPGLGGFCQSIQTRPNAVFVIKYLIKLPVGYSLQCAANPMGDSAIDNFVGSQEGTGRFTTYIRVVKCGATGVFSTTGYVYVSGSLQPSQTMWMTLAQLEVYDVTDFYNVQDDLNLFKSTVTQTYQTKADATSTTANIITQLESKASVTQAQNIADNTIKNTNIGGKNLITGTRYFETSGNLRPNYVGFGSLSDNPNDRLFGTNYICLATYSWMGFYFTDFKDNVLQEDCVLSFWASSQNNSSVGVYNIANGGTYLGTIEGAVWKQYSFLLPKGTRVRQDNGNQGVVEFSNISETGNVLAYSSIQLQVGNKATEWTPAPEDLVVGGRNILRNTDFSKGMQYWSTYNATITLGHETIEGKETDYAYIVSQGVTGGLYVKPADMPYVAKAGDVMTLSFYGRGDGTIIAGFDDTNNTITVDGTWKRYTVTLKRLRSDNVLFYVIGATYLDVALPKLELASVATAWSPAPEDIESKLVDFRAEVVNTYSTKADTTSAITTGFTEYRAEMGNTKIYTVASSYLTWAGVRNSRGVDLNRTWRSYGVDIFNANGDWARTYRYDVFGNAALADEVAARINESTEDEVVVITTYDEPASGRNAAMRAAFISIGGTGIAFDNIAYRSAYLLIGKKGLKEGGGIEQFTSGSPIEFPMQFINGKLASFVGSASQQMQTSATAGLLTQTQAKVSEHDGQISSLVQQTSTLSSNVTQAQNTANQAIIDAGNAITNRSEAINLTNGAYLQDLWYPVGIGGLSASTRSNISINAFLNNSSHPAWATHNNGFSLNLQWNTIGSGWGTIPVDRIINSFSHAFTASSLSPVTQISQFGASSIEVIWLRGGGVYYANFPKSASIYLPSTTDGSLTDPSTGEKASSIGYNAALVPKTVDAKTTTNSVVLQQQAEVINGIQAKWTVKINNNGYSTGFGLISEPNNGAIVSAFMVDADAFVVGKAGTNIKPIVAVTAGQTIEGTYYPESGTYLNSAWISKATIKLAHIDTATITSLSALSANLGSIKVGTANIANLAVDSGKIANLAVDTLKIKDNAVTIPFQYMDTTVRNVDTRARDVANQRIVLSSLNASGFTGGATVQVFVQSDAQFWWDNGVEWGGSNFALIDLRDVYNNRIAPFGFQEDVFVNVTGPNDVRYNVLSGRRASAYKSGSVMFTAQTAWDGTLNLDLVATWTGGLNGNMPIYWRASLTSWFIQEVKK